MLILSDPGLLARRYEVRKPREKPPAEVTVYKVYTAQRTDRANIIKHVAA